MIGAASDILIQSIIWPTRYILHWLAYALRNETIRIQLRGCRWRAENKVKFQPTSQFGEEQGIALTYKLLQAPTYKLLHATGFSISFETSTTSVGVAAGDGAGENPAMPPLMVDSVACPQDECTNWRVKWNKNKFVELFIHYWREQVHQADKDRSILKGVCYRQTRKNKCEMI